MTRIKISLFSIFLVIFTAIPSFADEFTSLLNGTRQKVGFYLYDLSGARLVSSYKETRPLQPASLQKIVTSYVSLMNLGTEYTFKTKVYVEGRSGNYVKRLIVKGEGDPSFDLNSMWNLVREIKKSGIEKIGEIALDDTYYIDQFKNKREGQRAYQARATSLALNYNSMQFKVCSKGCGSNAYIVNDPFEYEVNYRGNITSNNQKHFFTINESLDDPNLYDINGNFKCNFPCDTFYRSVKDPLLFFTQVFYEYLKYLNIKASPKFVADKVSPQSQLLFQLDGKPLREILLGLNHYSVNVTADHLVFANGKLPYGERFDNGLMALESAMKNMGCPAGCHAQDGSGLNKNNYVSALVLGNILKAIANNPGISSEFESSLPIMGRSGTLLKQKYLPKNVVVRAKTGTINGVRGLAGYIYSQRGRKYAFVIMQNGVDLGSAMVLEKKLVTLINNKINRF